MGTKLHYIRRFRKTEAKRLPQMPRARPVEFHVRRYKTTESLLLRPEPRAKPAVRGGAECLGRQSSSGERESPGDKPLASRSLPTKQDWDRRLRHDKPFAIYLRCGTDRQLPHGGEASGGGRLDPQNPTIRLNRNQNGRGLQ